MNASSGNSGDAGSVHRIFYGRRRGRKLRASMSALLEEDLPKLAIDPPGDGETLDPTTLFTHQPREIWLEIGFGAGEHLAWQADVNRDVGIVGGEPFLNGVASLLRHRRNLGVDNIRVYADDVRPLLDHLADGSFSRIFVLFPDPWPKTRHHFRRIVQAETIASFHRLLSPGGELRLATDDMEYLRWMLARVLRQGGFQWLAKGPRDWRERPEDWPATRYEEKAREAGRSPCFLSFVRNGGTGCAGLAGGR